MALICEKGNLKSVEETANNNYIHSTEKKAGKKYLFSRVVSAKKLSSDFQHLAGRGV